MEVALKRTSQRKYLLPLLIICLVMLIPSAIVYANAQNDPTIGMAGVNNSGLTIGMTGVNASDRLIQFGGGSHINPSSPSYGLMMSIPLIFFALAALLILFFAFNPQLDLRGLLITAILIILALALVVMVNSQTNSLLGG